MPRSSGGTRDCKGTEDLLPPAPDDRGAVRLAFEVDKALYELAYETGFPAGLGRDTACAPCERLLSAPVDELIAGHVDRPSRPKPVSERAVRPGGY